MSDLLQQLATMSAHTDVGTEMLRAAHGLGEYQVVGDGAACRALALVARGEPFAFVVGQRYLHFRLPPPLCAVARETGAGSSFAGADWIAYELFRCDFPRFDLSFWARKAYDHVRHC